MLILGRRCVDASVHSDFFGDCAACRPADQHRARRQPDIHAVGQGGSVEFPVDAATCVPSRVLPRPRNGPDRYVVLAGLVVVGVEVILWHIVSVVFNGTVLKSKPDPDVFVVRSL